MGMAPVAHVLFNKFMSFNPQNPDWVNRDRFVLSYVASMGRYGMRHCPAPANSTKKARKLTKPISQ